MRNLFETPRNTVRALTARLPFSTRLSCEAVEPLLMPFSENALDAKTHARIAQHVAGCPSCQMEVQMLGEMSDFFRANPPQPVVPAPNLWQSIEAQIQVETPERIAAFKTQPTRLPAPVPSTNRFDWNGFARSFAATGGVMTAAIACVWFVAGKFPVEHSVPVSSASTSAARLSEPDTVTVTLAPKRPAASGIQAQALAANRVERVPMLRQKSFVAAPQVKESRLLLPVARVAQSAPVRPAVLRVASGKFGFAPAKPERAPRALGVMLPNEPTHYYLYGDTGAASARYVNKTQDLDTAQTEALALASAETNGGDALPVVRKMLEDALEKATVVAVAASLPTANRQRTAPPAVVAVTTQEALYLRGATSPTINSPLSDTPDHNSVNAYTVNAPAVTARRNAVGTQVAWLVEEGARSERSAADATRTERRQQSLFSYGSR